MDMLELNLDSQKVIAEIADKKEDRKAMKENKPTAGDKK